MRCYGGGSRTKGIEYACRHNSTFSKICARGMQLCGCHTVHVHASFAANTLLMQLLQEPLLFFCFVLPEDVLMFVSEHSSGGPVMCMTA